MKKIVSIVLLLCVLCACLVSCGPTMEDFIKNFDVGYKIERYDSEKINDFADGYDLNAYDYGITAITKATSTGKGSHYAYIIECGSEDDAIHLNIDISDFVELYNKYYSFNVVSVVENEYVLIGAEDIVRIALGE